MSEERVAKISPSICADLCHRCDYHNATCALLARTMSPRRMGNDGPDVAGDKNMPMGLMLACKLICSRRQGGFLLLYLR